MILNEKSSVKGKIIPNQPLYLMVFVGSFLRCFHFLDNRSLWMDEVYLATSIIKMNYTELLTIPLYYQQKAPIGFLMLSKTVINIFGNKEMCLRFIPLASGIMAMLLFIPVVKCYLNKWGAYLAMAIFCFAPALVYHSVEIKQYATELLCTVFCLYLFIRYKNTFSLKDMFLWGILGAVIIWFSYSSIFILAGITTGLSLQNMLQKNWRAFCLHAVPGTIWLLSFGINYLFFTHKYVESDWITYWFSAYGNFVPLEPHTIDDFMWFPLNLYRLIGYPLGLLWNFNEVSSYKPLNILLKMPFIGILLLLSGTYLLIRKYTIASLILVMPMVLTLIASSLKLYPLTERFWVFLSPILVIIIGLSFEHWVVLINTRILRFCLFLLVITGPLVQSIIHVFHPERFFVHKKSFQREALSYVNNHIKPGDIVYIYWNNLAGYRLYRIMYDFNFITVEGKDVRTKSTSFENYYSNLSADFYKLTEANRIWLIYNRQFLTDIGDRIDEPIWYYQQGKNPTDKLLIEFNKLGTPIEKYITRDVGVYLFDPYDKSKQKM